MTTTITEIPTFLPYGRQQISDQDIEAVTDVLKSDWLTQGPVLGEFEGALAKKVGARHAVACSSGTAALHLTMMALGLGPGDQIVTSPNTFLASANAARMVGADVRFADIDPHTGNIDPDQLAEVLASDSEHRIKAVIPVHFAGQPVDMERIYEITKAHQAHVVSDACHALGSSYDGPAGHHRIGDGTHSDLTVFSFHPVKHITCGEGGAVTTDNDGLARRLRLLCSHGMQKYDFSYEKYALDSDGQVNPWYYEMHELGYNYRLTEIQAALGRSQLVRLDEWVERRNQLATNYRKLIGARFPADLVRSLKCRPDRIHGYHLFVLQIAFDRLGISRAAVMNHLRERGIGTQVHYIPVHLQPYYRSLYGHAPGDFPNAEKYYQKALSIPMFPSLTDGDQERVTDELAATLHL